MATRPASRSDFEIAIVCALPLEFDAVCLLVDDFWDEDGDPFGRVEGDCNTYTTGRIGELNVVLVVLANMGKTSAASAAASMRASYPRLKIVLLTGICGGVPFVDGEKEILLGDVIIAKSVLQYDLGRQYPSGFAIKSTVEDTLGRPTKNIRNLLTIFETNRARGQLEKRTASFLQTLQTAAARRHGTQYQYPGAAHDKLFQPSYRHKHQRAAECSTCTNPFHTCEPSRQMSCDDLGCNDTYLVQRKRLGANQEEQESTERVAPFVFVGRIGSGDTVVKSGQDRDRIAKLHNLIAFEMEGAGVWDEFPCIIIKAVCDYADSHKNKRWQDFAAATAASAMKALLERYPKTDKPPGARCK